MRGISIATALGGLLLCGSPALAGTEARASQHVSLGLAITAPDRDRAVDFGLGGTLGYALRLGPVWLETRLLATTFQDASPTGSAGAGLDLHLPLDRTDDHTLFLIAGGGWQQYDRAAPDGGKDASFANAGFGWRGTADTAFGLRPRAELRYVADGYGDGFGDVVLGLIAEFAPGRPPAPVVQLAAPRVVHIERPAPPPPPPPEPESPVLPALPPDGDRDGVLDADDACPETMQGLQVEKDGCVWKDQVVTLSDILFASGSAALAAGNQARLDEVARFFRDQAEVTMDIVGHTDAQGSDEYNLALSRGRAAAVREFLQRNGIEASRLSSQGKGESAPIASNDSKEGRARNRRVELRIHTRERS